MAETNSENARTIPELQKELLDFEQQLAEDPANQNLCWNIALTLGAIYAIASQGEMKGTKSDLDVDAIGERAIQAARRVVEVCPENPYSYTNLASFLMLTSNYPVFLKWSCLQTEDQISKAPEIRDLPISSEMFELYEKALEVNPSDCNFMGIMIPFCLSNGKFGRASELVHQSISVDGISNYQASLYLGRIEREKGNIDQAIGMFQELFGPNPESTDHECDLIETYRLAERFGEMLCLAKATLAKCPNSANAYRSLAKYHESQGKHEEAAQAHHSYCNFVNEQLKDLWFN